MNQPHSDTFRSHAEPKTRITPHQVSTFALKFPGKDHDFVIALKNQMIDDIRQRVEYKGVLVLCLDALEHCARLPVVEQAEAKARELLKALESEAK